MDSEGISVSTFDYYHEYDHLKHYRLVHPKRSLHPNQHSLRDTFINESTGTTLSLSNKTNITDSTLTDNKHRIINTGSSEPKNIIHIEFAEGIDPPSLHVPHQYCTIGSATNSNDTVSTVLTDDLLDTATFEIPVTYHTRKHIHDQALRDPNFFSKYKPDNLRGHYHPKVLLIENKLLGRRRLNIHQGGHN